MAIKTRKSFLQSQEKDSGMEQKITWELFI